jgi:predicted nucleic acid-binding protein
LNTLVIDASIAIKWVVEEDGTDLALALGQKARLMAPDLIVAECANILSGAHGVRNTAGD